MSPDSTESKSTPKTPTPGGFWVKWSEGIWITAVALLMMVLNIVVWPGHMGIRIVTFFVLPLAMLHAYSRRPLRDYGLDFRNVKAQVRWGIYAYLLLLPAIIVFAQREDFQQFYGFSEPDRTLFAYKMLVIHSIGMFAWEFLLRAFLLFGLAHQFGWWAVILEEVIIFPAAHVGKPFPEIVFAAYGGLVLSVAAYRSKSFLPAFVVHWFLAVTLDAIVFVDQWGWDPLLSSPAN